MINSCSINGNSCSVKKYISVSLCLCVLYLSVNMFLRPVGSKRYASPMSLNITMSSSAAANSSLFTFPFYLSVAAANSSLFTFTFSLSEAEIRASEQTLVPFFFRDFIT